jgi:serine protease Do
MVRAELGMNRSRVHQKAHRILSIRTTCCPERHFSRSRFSGRFDFLKLAAHIGNKLGSRKITQTKEGGRISMKRALLNLTCIGVGGLIGIICTQFFPSYAKGERTAPKIIVDDNTIARDEKFTSSFAPVIKKAAPSVVNIFTTKMVSQREMRQHPLFNDPLFREFFGDPGEMPRGRKQQQSLGSGVIVSQEGYVLTSNHIIEGADEIRVVMSSGKEFNAKVIGSDSATDTAVVKIEGEGGFPAITLANSEKLEVGDVVLAIGNPFGIGQTVTMGIISATGRGELGIVDYEDFIQTDASINPGNSGGALVDAQGRLIGINTAILSRTGGNQGVGFAIPINLSRSIMERLISDGKVTRGFLGVELHPMNPELAERLELTDSSGALVAAVQQGTPASEAGLKPGDLIVEYNGKKVIDHRQLRLMVSQTPPKTKAQFKLLRNGKEKTVSVELAELPVERTLSGMMRRGDLEPEESETLEGVEVNDIDARSRRQFSIPNHVRGALVTNVDPDSPAGDKLRPGDVILEIERKPVTSADEAIELSNDFKGGKVLLRVWSRGSTKYVFVEVDKKDKPAPEKDEEVR